MTKNSRSGCMVDKPNIIPCSCCGQDRPYPTEPGRWRYKTYGMGGWYNVTVKRDDEGLTITPDDEDEPIWWPSNAQWEQLD